MAGPLLVLASAQFVLALHGHRHTWRADWVNLFRHEHSAWVKVAHVECDQFSAIIVLGNVIDGSGATKSVHYAEADCVLIEHWLQHSAHSSLFRPYLATDWLQIPEVAAIGA